MDWFLFAFAVPFCWAGVVLMDKFFLTRHFKNPLSYQAFATLTSALALPVLWFFSRPTLSALVPFALLGGFFVSLSYVFYNKALMIDKNCDNVVSLVYLKPLFVVVLAGFFLGEVLKPGAYLGIFFLVFSALLVTYEEKNSWRRFGKVLSLVLAYVIIFALWEVASKWLLGSFDPFSLLFWSTLGGLPGGVLLLAGRNVRTHFFEGIEGLSKREWLMRFFSLSLFLSGFALFYFALSDGPVSLVSAVPSVQPFVVFVYTFSLSLFLPEFLFEKHTRLNVLLNSLGAVLLFIGTYLIVA